MVKKLLLTALLGLFVGGFAYAQTGTLTGSITDAKTNETLPAANILVVELSKGTSTDFDGNYTITDIPVGTYTIKALFVGYSPIEQTVEVTSGRNVLNVQLNPDTFGLDEIVVTGVISGTPKKKLAFTVSDVSAEDIEKVPSSDISGALQGKVSGVKVVQAGGTPGSAASIRLRGSTAIGGGSGGDQEPLIIVDGVILEGTLADIPTQNIKTIEVLKGASAASLYGSRAANGVIQIFTKRGSELAIGKTNVIVRNEVGYSQLAKDLNLAKHHAYARTAEELTAAGKNPADYEMDPTGSYMIESNTSNPGRVTKADGIADNDYGTMYNQVERVYNPGSSINNFVSVSRNLGTANMSLSFSNLQESGIIEETDGYNRQNVRINLDQNIAEGLDISASGSYSQSSNDVVTQGPGSPFWGALFIQPNIDLYANNEEDGSPYNVNADPYVIEDNPLYQLAAVDRTRDRNRFLGNLNLKYRPIQSVLLESSYSIDRTYQIYERWTPKGFLSADGFDTNVSKGSLYRSTYENVAQNLSFTAGYNERFDELTVRLKASYLLELSDYQSLSATGNDFAIAGIKSWDAIESDGVKTLDNYTSEVRSENIFAIASLDYKDRYIADFLVRQDGSSLFGEDERYNMYYRVSGAYRLTEDFQIDNINEWKLRVSYGTAGLRPPFAAQYLTYNVSGGLPTKSTLGNPNLKPALSKELEIGTNIEFLDRFSFETSYSTTTTEDQILSVPLPASAGGFSSRYENAGTIETNTFEASLNALLISDRDKSLSVTVNFDRTRQEVTQLDVAPFFQGPGTQNSSVFYVAEGETYGVMYGNKWVTDLSQLSTAQQNSGTVYELNNEGYVVTGKGTNSEAPVKMEEEDGNNVFKIGDVNPDFNTSIATNFDYKGFGVYFLLDAKIGGDIYNQTKAWLFREARHGEVDQAGVADADKKPKGYFEAFYNANNTSDYFVEDGTYLKLREVALSYEFSKDKLGVVGNVLESARVSVIGRNLLTITNYSGFDPEVAGTGGDITNFAFDGYSYPNFRTFSASLELRF
ncbi:SusC/RagA family TonB-linked outer membrane protein [Balneola vulgaris]|uniref:SusC/RagA family TonB-linked outer membrane protein n=1 Tax=Balneola vulgaris TaxID=287535 RepID=UPI0003782CED|nr:SusC/RagA family TonB-linked outer membrane protein [Balneola vulgaris]